MHFTYPLNAFAPVGIISGGGKNVIEAYFDNGSKTIRCE